MSFLRPNGRDIFYYDVTHSELQPRGLIIQQMITMPVDLRETALIAGVTSAVSLLWSYGHEILEMGTTGVGPIEGALTLLPLHLLSIPWLVLLFLLCRTEIALTVSPWLRHLALALAAIDCGAIAFACWTEWHLQFHGSPARIVISGAIELSAMLGFLVFLFALSRQSEAVRETDARQVRLLRKAAVIAICARGAGVLLVVLGGIEVYSLQRRGVTHMSIVSPASTVRRAVFALPGLVAPWIIYMSARQSRLPGVAST